MISYIRYFRGYVRLRMTGLSPERFLNLCSVYGISLWDISAKGKVYELNMSVADFFRLKPILKKTKTKVVLLSKKGLPFFVQQWKQRKLFLAGCIICMTGLYCVSLFLWDIRLTSQGRLTDEMLMSFLQDNGIGYGSYIKGIDTAAAEKKLRDEFPFVLWTSFHIEGTRLCVDVKENDKYREDNTEEEEACNLYATLEGEVVSIVTRCGNPKVKEGDMVKKGDLLVDGEIPVVGDDLTVREYMYVKSDADIMLKTELRYQKEQKLDYEKKEYTGREKRTFYARIRERSFSTGGVPEYETYDVTTDMKQAKILENFYLPLYIGTITYREYEMGELVYSEKEAKALLEYDFKKFCKTLQQKGIQIVEKNVKIRKNGRSMHADGIIVVNMPDGEAYPIARNKETGDMYIE